MKIAKYRRHGKSDGEWYLTDFTMEQVEGRLNNLEAENATLKTERDAAIKEVSVWATKFGHLEAETAYLKAQLKISKDIEDGLMHNQKVLLKELAELQSENATLKARNAILEQSILEYEEELACIPEDIDVGVYVSSLKAQLAELREQVKNVYDYQELLREERAENSKLGYQLAELRELNKKLRGVLGKTALRAWALSKKKDAIGKEWMELREALIWAYNARYGLCLNGDPDDPPTDPLSYDTRLNEWKKLLGDEPRLRALLGEGK